MANIQHMFNGSAVAFCSVYNSHLIEIRWQTTLENLE